MFCQVSKKAKKAPERTAQKEVFRRIANRLDDSSEDDNIDLDDETEEDTPSEKSSLTPSPTHAYTSNLEKHIKSLENQVSRFHESESSDYQS